MAQPGEKNISAFVDPEVSKDFKQQCEGRKYFKNAALEGAIRGWLTLDRVTQGELMEGKTKPESEDDNLDEQIRQLARDLSAISEKLKHLDLSNSQKKAQRK